MPDQISPEHRSWNMSRIRSKDTTPELMVRSLIHRAGYRFSLHSNKMPGKPDIVMSRYRTVIFVNGCFWHRHPDCRYCTTPGTNTEYWEQKFKRTVARDREAHAQLRKLGWTVLVVWECQTRDKTRLLNFLDNILPDKF